MLMKVAPIGKMVFVEEAVDDERTHEIRETYYVRNSDNTYLRLGIAQGEDGEPPRYQGFAPGGYQYPLVPTLKVRPISESCFFPFHIFPFHSGRGAFWKCSDPTVTDDLRKKLAEYEAGVFLLFGKLEAGEITEAQFDVAFDALYDAADPRSSTSSTTAIGTPSR